MSGLIEQVSLHPGMTLTTDQSTSTRAVNNNFHSSSLIIPRCQVLSLCVKTLSLYVQPSSGQSSSLLMKTSYLRLELVELTSL